MQQSPPTLGWVVCVSGPERGAEYRLTAVQNYIGSAAVIVYDDARQIFTFGPCDVKTTVRLNGQTVTTAAVLSPYDRLSTGDSEWVFVPLCSYRFHWPEAPILDAELEAEDAPETPTAEEPEGTIPEEPEVIQVPEIPEPIPDIPPELPIRTPSPELEQQDDPYFPFLLASSIVTLLIGVIYYFGRFI